VLLNAAQRAVGGIRRPAVLDRSSRLCGFAARLAAALTLLFGTAAIERGAAAQSVAAEIAVDTTGGYARMVYHFNGDVDANARVANGILVISFNVPVTLSTDRLSSAAAGYVSAARRDPDGKGLRIALARKLTLHSMQANDRLFVDLLPDNWSGPPPSLPQDVVEDLARRAKEAERRARQIRLLAQQKQMVETRVRVAHQPNFSRYVFELPELVTVTAERNGDKLNVQFDAPLKFDLAEAKASLPATIENIDAETGEQTTTIKFSFLSKVDIRSFREDNTYIIDVAPMDRAAPRADATPTRQNNVAAPAAANEAPTGLEVPMTVPPRDRPMTAAANAARGGDRSSAAAARPAALALDEVPPSMTFDPAKALEAANLGAQKPTIDVAGNSVARGDPATPLPRGQDQSTERPLAAAAEKADAEPPRTPPQAVAESSANPAGPDSAAPVRVRVERQNDNLKLVFPFDVPTSGAIFRRADTLWAVFDSTASIDAAALQHDPTLTIGTASVGSGGDFQFVRIKLERPRLASFSAGEDSWTIAIGDVVLDPTLPLAVTRNSGSRPSVAVAFEKPQAMHRLVDPDIGDTLYVVTGFAPARGLLKEQDFLEFHILASTHGIVIQPLADDVDTELAGDKALISRPPGLILSAANEVGPRGYRPVVLDPQSWGFDREADFGERQKALIAAAAAAPAGRRMPARFELARFYLAREMFAEAKGVLDVALAEDHPTVEDPTGLVMRAIAKIMMGRVDEGLRDLASPLVGNTHDAQLWRALAFAKQGKWGEANENFKRMETAITTLPMEFQRQVILEAVRASIETRDFAAAAAKLNEFETLGAPKELGPRIAMLSGRLAESLGQNEEALAAYRAAAESSDRVSAARGHLYEILLRYQLGEMKRPDVISELETLTTFWRGDDTEIEALQVLAHLYTEDGRYREAFHVMRTAFKAHPNSELTRRIQDEAAATFESLFLAGKGDAMPAVEALALFYDFRELTPIGRRGDEMIRRLADRLVSVDLLDQAAELLQHQVDHRLQGAARAQVAARLAVVYLMNRKPDKALAVLRSTRTADVANELRNQRLLIEARALSDVGRHDVAVDIVSNITGPEAVRLRADVYWEAKRWREASEQMELFHGERWKDFEPLSDLERADLLRAAIGYALADDAIGLGRFREKYAAKMAEGPDRRAFEVATSPLIASSAEFRDVVRQIASVDTLDGFLRELYARFPETGSFAGGAAAAPAPVAPAPTAPAGARVAPGNAQMRRAADPNPTASLGLRASIRR
jgi:tetratricopeptide (TPR) repeat protein